MSCPHKWFGECDDCVSDKSYRHYMTNPPPITLDYKLQHGMRLDTKAKTCTSGCYYNVLFGGYYFIDDKEVSKTEFDKYLYDNSTEGKLQNQLKELDAKYDRILQLLEEKK